MALSMGSINTTYIINSIKARQKEMHDFLFTLGCYPGQEVTIISRLADNFIINIKDSRYSIDKELANAIFV